MATNGGVLAERLSSSYYHFTDIGQLQAIKLDVYKLKSAREFTQDKSKKNGSYANAVKKALEPEQSKVFNPKYEKPVTCQSKNPTSNLQKEVPEQTCAASANGATSTAAIMINTAQCIHNAEMCDSLTLILEMKKNEGDTYFLQKQI